MNTALWWVAQNTVVTAAMIPLVMLLCRCFRTRPAVQHALWTVVLLKFVTPVIVFWPWELPDIRQTITAHMPAPNPRANVSQDAAATLLDEGGSVGFEQINSQGEHQSRPLSLADGIYAILISVWGLGTFGFAVRQYRRVTRQAAIVRQGSTAPTSLSHSVQEVASQLGLRPFPTLIVRGIASPFVWCLGRLKLAWPEELLHHHQAIAPRSIIAHELAHVRRYDHWLAWVEMAAAMIWWWNPLFWLVRKKARASAEMSCDALALAAYPDDRCEYAEMLLWLSANSKTGAPVFVLGVNTGTPSSFERRMSMIVSQNVSGKLSLWGMIVAGCIALVALPGWLIAQQEPASTDPQVVETSAQRESTSERLDRLEAQIQRLIALMEQPNKPASPEKKPPENKLGLGEEHSAFGSSAVTEPKKSRIRSRGLSDSYRSRGADPNSAEARLDRLERAVERLTRRLQDEPEKVAPAVDPNVRSIRSGRMGGGGAGRLSRIYESGEEDRNDPNAPRTDDRGTYRHRKADPRSRSDDKPGEASTTTTSEGLGVSVGPDGTITGTSDDGRVVWKSTLGESVISRNVEVDGDTVVVHFEDGSVKKFDLKTGKQKE